MAGTCHPVTYLSPLQGLFLFQVTRRERDTGWQVRTHSSHPCTYSWDTSYTMEVLGSICDPRICTHMDEMLPFRVTSGYTAVCLFQSQYSYLFMLRYLDGTGINGNREAYRGVSISYPRIVTLVPSGMEPEPCLRYGDAPTIWNMNHEVGADMETATGSPATTVLRLTHTG